MNDTPLPPRLLQFIASSLPSYEGAVFLVFLSREPDRQWTLDQLGARLGADAITRRELEEFLGHFERMHLLRRTGGESFRFDPGTPELAETVAELRDAYDHRPVTLIRVVRDSANARLKSFSDSFRLKEE